MTQINADKKNLIPMLHYFNPGHEWAVLNGSPYYMPPANVARMQRDLAFLPAWYANNGDFVWIEKALPNDFVDFLSENFQLNVQAVDEETLSQNPQQLIDNEVMPWGISLQSIHFFEMLNEKYALNLHIPHRQDCYTQFCHRETAAKWLQTLCENITELSTRLIPQFLTSVEAVEQLLQAESETAFLAKAPYSSSGKGLLWLPKGKITRTEQQIIHGILKKQKSVSLEYVLDKKTDFAMEFYCDGAKKTDFIGYSHFQTNAKGAYESNIIAPQHDIEYIITEKAGCELTEKVKSGLTDLINRHLSPVYKGYLGVDMMLYEQNGKTKLHPCVEINLRSNMGIVAIHLQKHLAENARGHFYVIFSRQAGELYQQHLEKTQHYPLSFSDGKVSAGYFPLCPVDIDSHYTAYVVVSKF